MIPQLRHLRLAWNYLQYHELTEKSLVLKKLQFLYGLNPKYCTGYFCRLFSNLKKLQIHGIIEDFSSRKNLHDFCYLNQHEELEFCLEYPLSFDRKILVPPLLLHPPCAFLKNLKNLAFTGQFSLPSKDLSIAVKLSKLKSLKLEFDAFIGEWELAKEGFPHLKFLLLKFLLLQHWRACSDHFPYLEWLFHNCCWKLDQSLNFADITTLTLVDIKYCAICCEFRQTNSTEHSRQLCRFHWGPYKWYYDIHLLPWFTSYDCFLIRLMLTWLNLIFVWFVDSSTEFQFLLLVVQSIIYTSEVYVFCTCITLINNKIMK